jgi:osomolarity two-component system, response regulator SKN7
MDLAHAWKPGMNDVLPKPFTKEGLLQMLEKHLAHLKKPVAQIEPMPPQPLSATRQSLKEEESPAKSPATTSNWNSPNPMTGVSPVNNNVPEEYMHPVQGHQGPYGMNPMQQGQMQQQMSYNASPQMQMQARQPQGGHRRQISDISGGDDLNNPAKRQQMYGAQLQQQQQQQQQMNPMQQGPR